MSEAKTLDMKRTDYKCGVGSPQITTGVVRVGVCLLYPLFSWITHLAKRKQ